MSPARNLTLLFLATAWLASGQVNAQTQDPPTLSVVADTLDEVVAESEQERKRKALPTRRIDNPDVITVMRRDTIRVRVQPRSPQNEIRFRRASAARQAAENVRPPMKLERDQLSSGGGPQIRDVTLGFAPGIVEADGLPALIPFGHGTSLFNIDYVRLRETAQPTLINLSNVLDPETRRCDSTLGVGNAGSHPHRFLLLADKFTDCTRTVMGREGDLMFADNVPDALRQELRDLYDPVYNRFAKILGSEPGVLFVAWLPDAPRNDFRFVLSLNRTNLLLLEGPAWTRGLAPQQRDALWEEVAMEQIVRRIYSEDAPDAVLNAAADYLLNLARSERDHSTTYWLKTNLPDWINACARSLTVLPGTANPSQRGTGYSCGLVVQFVYDAVARAESKGEEGVHRNWRALLADSFRRGKSGVRPEAFLDSSVDARRIAQGVLRGTVDWTRFAADLASLGVRLRVTPDKLTPNVEVVSLSYFRD